MKIAIGADHRGFTFKQNIIQNKSVAGQTIEWIDVGCSSTERCDYPLYTQKVSELVQQKKVELGVLLCGSGIGMSIAANRFKGVFAALAWNIKLAQLAREHNHANILVLPADFVSEDQTLKMLATWLQATPHGERYKKRVDTIDSWGGI